MKNKLIFGLLLLVVVSAHAVDEASVLPSMTPDEMFIEAAKNGHVRAVMKGPQADDLRKQTHSSDPTIADVTVLHDAPVNCSAFLMSVTQPNVPTRSGANAGDFVSKTKITLCNDERQPVIDVVDCTVGMKSCMPIAAKQK